MKLKRPRSRAQLACALAALGSSALLAGGVLASPAAAGVLASPAAAGRDTTVTGDVATGANQALRLAVPQASTTKGTGVIDWSINDGAEQQWTFKPTGEALATFQIINKNSNMCLTVDASRNPGDQVYQWPCSPISGQQGSMSQQWKTGLNVDTKGNDGYYPIQNVYNGMYLDVSGDSFWQGTVVDTWPWNGGRNQIWALNVAGVGIELPIPPDLFP